MKKLLLAAAALLAAHKCARTPAPPPAVYRAALPPAPPCSRLPERQSRVDRRIALTSWPGGTYRHPSIVTAGAPATTRRAARRQRCGAPRRIRSRSRGAS